MTYLSPDRDALREAQCECGHPVSEWHHPTRGCTYLGVGINACRCERDFTDALIASGAVIDAATLADDEALVGGLTQAIYDEMPATYPANEAHAHYAANGALRALAAALTEREGTR